MRIEHPHTHATQATDKAQGDSPRPAAGSSVASGQDRISLSGDLRLVYAALQQTGPIDSGVRPEAVARGRALVASGDIDTDLDALAEILLPDLVDSHDDPS